MHLELGPHHVEQIFEMLHDLAGVGRRCGHQEIVLAKPPGGAVVERQPVLAQHQPVARLADGERGEQIGVDAIEEGGGIRALHGDLAERRDVDDADAGAHGPRLAHIGLLDGLAGLAVDHRPIPQACGVHDRALPDVPVVHGGEPLRLQLAIALRRQRAQRDGRKRRAEAGRADLVDRLAERVGHDGEAGHVGGLALVGRHAERGVALRCSTETKPSRCASLTSSAVTSCWKSTKALPFPLISKIGEGGHVEPVPVDIGQIDRRLRCAGRGNAGGMAL